MKRAAWLCLLAFGCDQGPRTPGSPAIDPRRPALESRYEPMPLTAMTLVTHEDYDRWEKAVESRGGPRLVHALYQELLTKQRGASRTFVRWVYYAHERGLGDDVTGQLNQLVDALAARADAQSDPDILFVLGYIGWVRLIGGAGQPAAPAMGAGARGSDAVADVVRKSWEPLVKQHPDWRGPNGLSAATVGVWLASLTPADTGAPAASTAPAPPALLGGLLHQIGEKGAKVACEGLDDVVRALPNREDASLASLGDVYAICALERGNPEGAVQQLERMLVHRVPGGFNSILARVGDAAGPQVAALRKRFAEVRAADPAFAQRAGIATP